MSYSGRSKLFQPDAESIQRSRRTMMWFIPIIIVQQGVFIFRSDADAFAQLFGTLAWGSVSIVLVWLLLGLPLRWVSEEDQAILNDEWNRSISGEAARWGIAALVVLGCGMMVARIWYPLNAGLAVYGLVNGALVVASCRYAWLNRGEPDEDE
ncbi:MAG TPA: hypothetical protein VH331_14010 [Allosphingosinicella sp.]|jgi:hypothetical protein|nr:hypothetical protein [Allosphingosinicella sp.]